MIKPFVPILLVTFMVGSCNTKKTDITSEPLSIIFETDMGNDVDDALALDMLYKYMDADSINLLAISSNKNSRYSTEFIDLMNTWYGYPKIPIGRVVNGPECAQDAKNYAEVVCEMEVNGKKAFKRTVRDIDSLPEATALYRKILSKQPDNSVIIISVGFSTNLARLLDTPPDRYSPQTGLELVTKKVKLLSVMGGSFGAKKVKEYNIVKDIASARKVLNKWPSRINLTPFELGISVEYPGRSIMNDFQWTPMHPMVEAYKSYLPMPYDRPTWDLIAVLNGIDPKSEMFTESPRGDVSVDSLGYTKFSKNEAGKHSYITADQEQIAKIKDYLINLITQKPRKYNKN